MALTALCNGRVLLGDELAEGRAVLIEGERILDVVDARDPRALAARRHDLAGALLLPGFIDTQLNGGGGVLFNDAPSADAIRAIGRAHRPTGTTGFLPTLISDELPVVARAIDAARSALRERVPGTLGIHLEGPFINPARKGIHDPRVMRRLEPEQLPLLTSLELGKTLITLAPERTAPHIIEKLCASGVLIAAGHTDASYAEMQLALRQGLTGFTHLFNAMSQISSREPGTVGAALEHPDSWCGIIADGRHVAPAVLRLALRIKPLDRFMLVTDAMPSVGSPELSFRLQGRPIRVENGVCVDEHGVLAGSHLDMASAVRNAISMLGLPLPEAARMASQYPADFLGLGDQYGRIAPGYRASLVAVDDDLQVLATWIDGECEVHGV